MTKTESSTAIFLLDSVSKSFGKKMVLRGVDLAVGEGQCVVILGHSGAGKSVLMRLLLGFIPPDEGRVRFQGELPLFSPYRSAQAGKPAPLGVLFQNDALLEDLSIQQNLALGARAFNGDLEESTQRNNRELLQRVGLDWETVAHLKPSQLSGGMRKRAALARALACRPQALLIDEPTSGLDIHSSRQIITLLRDEVRARRMTAVVITHDLECARTLADRLLLLNGHTGQLTELSTQNLQIEQIAAAMEEPVRSAGLSREGAITPKKLRAEARTTYLRERSTRWLESIGSCAAVVAKALPFPSPREFVRRLRQTLLDSLPLTAAIFLLIGMILFVQTRAALSIAGFYNLLPDALAEAILKLAPAFLGLVMAGRLGSVICAEVGLLRQTEQLDAMRVLGIAPERHLLSPSLWAAVISFPMLVVFAEAMALGGAMLMLLIPSQSARVGAVQLFQGTLRELEMPLLMTGLVKACLFGVVIVLCGYFFGARDQRGSSAIGRSITGAIVASFIAIVALDFVMSFFAL